MDGMLRRRSTAIVLATVLCLVVGVLIASAQAAPNLLVNPGFEGVYTHYDNEVHVAQGWGYFWDPWHHLPPLPGGTIKSVRRPEYKEITAALYPYRVKSGDKAQCYFAWSDIMDAGVYQVVAAQEGAFYQGSAWVQAWSSNADSPQVSDGEMYVSLGIDPQGGTNAYYQTVVWSDWALVRSAYVQLKTPVVQARSNRITFYVRAWHKWALKHGDVYVDDASLMAVGGGVSPAPTVPATSTPPVVGVDYERIRGIMREELDKTRLGQ